MELLQMEFPYKKPSQLKKIVNHEEGFILLLLLPFFSLIITGLFGITIMSLGIKNITLTKKTCILENLSTQKKLKIILKKILSLNKKIIALHAKRKLLESSLKISAVLGLANVMFTLKKQITIIKYKQRLLSFQQNRLLAKSQMVKVKALKNLKHLLNKKYIRSIKEDSYFKKALALSKKKLSKEATIYKLLPRFSDQQKIIFSWEMNPFFPLKKSNFSKYKCIATLERSKLQWKQRLSH